ncbi:MAG TPA: PBP1A family penicillin-binding protein [Firmicutes bacterium]|nr:PBP1A family penicillin-binding protein [Bacillota bacterium]
MPRKSSKKMPKTQRSRSKSSGYVSVVIFIIALLGGAFAGAFFGFLGSAPTLAEVTFNPQLTTYVYDRNGEVLAKLYIQDRELITLDQIPQVLIDATLAIEDQNFYTHYGISLRGIVRALFVNLKEGEAAQGGSTITQQLAKNAFLSNERTLIRKLRELLWTVQIERRYTKDEILTAYLNEIPYGHGAYGVAAATQLYFGKEVSRLTLPEAAFLAGVSNGPAVFSPYINYEAAIERRNIVLRRMHELGYISRSELDEAIATPLVTASRQPNQHRAPYFVDYILQILLNLYGKNQVYGGGLRVYTTLDVGIQAAAEEALLTGLPNLYKDSNGLQQPQGAIIALDPTNGAIQAMVGGRGTDKFNRAVQAVRQPGSAFKPIVYAAALEERYAPSSVLVDEEITLVTGNGTTWSPQNVDHRYRGEVTLREALEQSINTIAVKLTLELTPRTVIDYGRRLGITTLVDKGDKNDMHAAIGLGGLTKGVSPLELAAAYVPFTNGGYYCKPMAITKIVDAQGTILFEARPDRRVVMSAALADTMTDMLQGVVERGTGTKAQIGRPAAGKTGTTNDYTNAWFVGYTPQLVAAVWLGNDAQVRPMTCASGPIGSGKAAEIWARFMKSALKDQPVMAFSATSPP